jgi:hypothetical protein
MIAADGKAMKPRLQTPRSWASLQNQGGPPRVLLPEGAAAPITELEIGVVCPKGVVCPEHEPVKIRFHWVCGTTEADEAGSFICKETDFDITATVYEKIVLTPTASRLALMPLVCRVNSHPRLIVQTAAGT